MSVGSNIRKLRTNNGLTQVELSEKLHISSMILAKWEENLEEPSIEKVKEIANLFNCSYSDILDGTKEEITEELEEDKPEQETNENKHVLAVCEKCGKPIYNELDLKMIEVCVKPASHSHSVRHSGPGGHRSSSGNDSPAVYRQQLLCSKCYDEHNREIAKLEQEKVDKLNKLRFESEERDHKKNKKRQIHSFIWSSLATILICLISIYFFKNSYKLIGLVFIALAIMAFTFTSCMILYNNFISKMWIGVLLWAVQIPIDLCADGIDDITSVLELILVFLLGIPIAIVIILFITLLCFVLSIFTYPFALVKNIKNCR